MGGCRCELKKGGGVEEMEGVVNVNGKIGLLNISCSAAKNNY